MPHINYLYDYTITIYIVNPDYKVLLVEHPKYGKWIPVGGHIEMDEDPEDALYREVLEETGLNIEVLSNKPSIESTGTKFLLTPNYVDVHEANAPHKHISFTYFARSKGDKFAISSEHSDMKWFDGDELTKPEYGLSDAIKFYSKHAIETARTFNL